MSTAARRLIAGLAAVFAMVLGAGPAASTPVDAEAAGIARPGWAPGPDGLQGNHNETLVRDVS